MISEIKKFPDRLTYHKDFELVLRLNAEEAGRLLRGLSLLHNSPHGGFGPLYYDVEKALKWARDEQD